jgi:hypothetical protein
VAVTLNQAALARLLESEDGAVGREVRERAEAVERVARQNASGVWLNIQTGDLLAGLAVRPWTGNSLAVGSDAEHRGFRYPGYWNEAGRPWLLEAVAAVFPP